MTDRSDTDHPWFFIIVGIVFTLMCMAEPGLLFFVAVPAGVFILAAGVDRLWRNRQR